MLQDFNVFFQYFDAVNVQTVFPLVEILISLVSFKQVGLVVFSESYEFLERYWTEKCLNPVIFCISDFKNVSKLYLKLP